MSNNVTSVAAAASNDAEAHFSKRLTLETDCWDVHDALSRGASDFVVLDVRGPNSYEAGHIPGAISLPHGKITESRMSEWPPEMTFVVYCAGPHCNGANKAAVRLARLGRPVKEMIGGITGWADEGFDFARGSEPGSLSASEAAA
jgi:rhodanese-related sulfurtransferase